jgi:hypothetical protein
VDKESGGGGGVCGGEGILHRLQASELT